MGVITIQQLTKYYGSRVGVAELSVDVGDGTVLGFLGPNGSGKTTTIRVLLGLLKPTAGSARILGLDCWRDSHRLKTDVGYLAGDLRLYSWLTCRVALDIFGRVRGLDLLPAGMELAEEFGLPPDLRVRNMSHGMRQKLGLILALVHKPKVLVLDEPTTALDPLMQEKLFRHLRVLTSVGHTVFLSSHTLGEVERLCDRVVILRQGRLVADETLESLRSRARRQVTVAWQPSVDPAAVDPPPFLAIEQVSDRRWRAALTGPVMEFVKWSATQPIADVSIGQPDLGAMFRDYYLDGEQA